VHALRQVAHVHLDSRLSDDRLCHALNAHLVEGAVIPRLETCRDDFHARFDARAKRYLYVVRTTRFRPPFARGFSHWVHHPLDVVAMRQAARSLLGTHDFRAFGNVGSIRKTTVRTLTGLRIVARQGGLAFVVQGDGFLYKMVRNLVGTLLAVGRGKLPPGAAARALASGRRVDAGPTAPAQGLFLARVLYPEAVFVGRAPAIHGEAGTFQLGPPGSGAAKPGSAE
jgi:tRNA pseudouridine38-40 synthase